MKHDLRYIQNESKFLQYATACLCSRFISHDDFGRFYAALPDNEAKNAFLRVASFYYFLVKNGDWVNRLDGEQSVTDYLTNSYKLVGIFSLIESLSDLEHQDFCHWLSKNASFPIDSLASVQSFFDKYNQEHGATRRCVAFFNRLPARRQDALMRAIRIRGKCVSSVRRAIQVLYGLRSRFVHESSLALQFSSKPLVTVIGGRGHTFDLRFSELAELFEEALIMHFAAKHSIPVQKTVKSLAFSVS